MTFFDQTHILRYTFTGLFFMFTLNYHICIIKCLKDCVKCKHFFSFLFNPSVSILLKKKKKYSLQVNFIPSKIFNLRSLNFKLFYFDSLPNFQTFFLFPSDSIYIKDHCKYNQLIFTPS